LMVKGNGALTLDGEKRKWSFGVLDNDDSAFGLSCDGRE
jgi:hypothetical protein